MSARAARSAILLPLLLCGAFSQPPQPRSEEERAADLKKRVIETLQLRPGDTAADVGCGDGFYTIPLARFLGPSGNVYAEDINDAALVKLRERLDKEGLQNVEVIKGAVDDPELPASRLDAVLIVNAYHEMTAHETMFRHVMAALKSGGTFVLMEGIWDSREGQSREEQIKHHVAKATGIKVVTIRYYEQIGLVPAPARSEGNYRSYNQEHLRRLRFIRRCRDLGFTLLQVRELLRLSSKKNQECSEVDRITARHLADVEQKISDLRRLSKELHRLSACCRGDGLIADCRIIEALSPI